MKARVLAQHVDFSIFETQHVDLGVIIFILFEFFESGKRPGLPDFSPNEKFINPMLCVTLQGR